jgi:hypothetical protein
MRCHVLLLLLAGSCAGVDQPTASDLYGTWSRQGGASLKFVFAASDDGSHPELAGKTNVYVLTSSEACIANQTGTYTIGTRAVPDFGTTEALIMTSSTPCSKFDPNGNATVGFCTTGVSDGTGSCPAALYGWSSAEFWVSSDAFSEPADLHRGP